MSSQQSNPTRRMTGQAQRQSVSEMGPPPTILRSSGNLTLTEEQHRRIFPSQPNESARRFINNYRRWDENVCLQLPMYTVTHDLLKQCRPNADDRGDNTSNLSDSSDGQYGTSARQQQYYRLPSVEQLMSGEVQPPSIPTLFNSAQQAAEWMSSSLQHQVDITLPTTAEAKRVLVGILAAAVNSTAKALGSRETIAPFQNAVHSARIIEWQCWRLLEQLLKASMFVTPITSMHGEQPLGVANYENFATRFDAMVHALQHSKAICARLVESDLLVRLAEDPLGCLKKSLGVPLQTSQPPIPQAPQASRKRKVSIENGLAGMSNAKRVRLEVPQLARPQDSLRTNTVPPTEQAQSLTYATQSQSHKPRLVVNGTGYAAPNASANTIGASSTVSLSQVQARPMQHDSEELTHEPSHLLSSRLPVPQSQLRGSPVRSSSATTQATQLCSPISLTDGNWANASIMQSEWHRRSPGQTGQSELDHITRHTLSPEMRHQSAMLTVDVTQDGILPQSGAAAVADYGTLRDRGNYLPPLDRRLRPLPQTQASSQNNTMQSDSSNLVEPFNSGETIATGIDPDCLQDFTSAQSQEKAQQRSSSLNRTLLDDYHPELSAFNASSTDPTLMGLQEPSSQTSNLQSICPEVQDDSGVGLEFDAMLNKCDPNLFSVDPALFDLDQEYQLPSQEDNVDIGDTDWLQEFASSEEDSGGAGHISELEVSSEDNQS